MRLPGLLTLLGFCAAAAAGAFLYAEFGAGLPAGTREMARRGFFLAFGLALGLGLAAALAHVVGCERDDAARGAAELAAAKERLDLYRTMLVDLSRRAFVNDDARRNWTTEIQR